VLALSEKGHEVVPDTLVCFGVKMCSRYGKVYELIRMMRFCEQLAHTHVSTFVEEVFYDSKACLCTFTLTESAELQEEVLMLIFKAALENLGQFEWIDGAMYDGETYDDSA
jgi:hypothetical protein